MSGKRTRYERTEWVRDQILPHRPLRRLLDVGGHDGASAAVFARAAAGLAINTDVDLAALRHGYRERPEVRHVAASGAALPFPAGSFDAVTCVEVLEHVPAGEERRVLEEMRRVCVPGGLLVLTTPHAGWFAWLDPMDARARLRRLRGQADKGHKHFALAELLALVDGLFAVDRVYRNSLLLHPLSTALGRIDPGGGWLTRLRERMSDWDWAHDFGRASFNVGLVAHAI